jgi:predicted PurR-regulated permease PerM
MERPVHHDAIFWFFLILFIGSVYLLGWLLWPFISVIIMAVVVTGIVSPLYRFICRRVSRSVASLITCGVIFVVLFFPIVLFVGILSGEAYGLYQMGRDAVISDQVKSLLQASHLLDKINPLLAHVNIELSGTELNNALSELGKQVGLFVYQQASTIASNVLSFLVYFFLMLMIIYFLLMDGHKLISFLIDLSPLPTDQEEILISKFKNMSGAILVGNGLAGLIQGFLGGLLFYSFGLKSPFMWGVIMALLAFLPIVGIGAVFVPTVAYLILKGRIAAGIVFIVFYLVVSGGIEYLVKPKLVGRQVQMHTLLVFLSIMGGLKLFGILGIIYGPLIVTAFLTLADIYRISYQDKI